MLLILEFAMISHWIILFSFISFLFHFTFKYQHFYVRWEGKKYTRRAKCPPLLWAKCPYMSLYPMVVQVGILPQSCDYCDTEYFKSIHNNYMEMQVIFVINFNRMAKAIGQCKSGKLLGTFGNMTIRIMGYDSHWKPKYYTLEVCYEMFMADM